jgi:hypothetical protein
MNHIKQIKQIINQHGGMGYNILNKDLVNVVLNVFPSKYYTLVVLISFHDVPPSFANFEAKLFEEEIFSIRL